jgi:hypothetical protein
MPELMSQTAYARHRGVSRKTVTVWKQQGILVLGADGQVDVAATDAVLAVRPDRYRGGATSGSPVTPGNKHGNKAATQVTGDGLAADDEQPDPDGLMTLPQAQRAKETYLALQRKAEFEEQQGRLVSVETVGKYVEAEYGLVRDRLVVIPGKVADKCTGKPREEIEAIIMAEINEALNELHAPSVESRG